MLDQISSSESRPRFVFELVIRTQPSGPLCLWQCFLKSMETRQLKRYGKWPLYPYPNTVTSQSGNLPFAILIITLLTIHKYPFFRFKLVIKMSPGCIAVQALVHHRLSSALTGPEWQLLVMPVHVQCTLYIHVLYGLFRSWSLVHHSAFILRVTQSHPLQNWGDHYQASAAGRLGHYFVNSMLWFCSLLTGMTRATLIIIILPDTNVCKNCVICNAIYLTSLNEALAKSEVSPETNTSSFVELSLSMYPFIHSRSCWLLIIVGVMKTGVLT